MTLASKEGRGTELVSVYVAAWQADKRRNKHVERRIWHCIEHKVYNYSEKRYGRDCEGSTTSEIVQGST